ncbi:MAG: DUF2189 domain-containing protein [Rhodocyclaceae bacterium]
MDHPLHSLEQHFALPAVAHHVPAWRPLTWLDRGLSDLRGNPVSSLAHGAVITAIFAAVLLLGADHPYFFTAAVSGFLLVAPLLTMGVYEISRLHGMGQTASFAQSIVGWRRNAASVGMFGLVLCIIAIAWERISAILFALLYGGNAPELGTFIAGVFLTGDYPRVLAGFIVLGAILAALVFALAAVSLPMMMDRGTDVATAMMTSVKVVVTNPLPMAVWAGTIVLLVAIGFATALVGLVVIMPLLGHATWHAYKELVDEAA